MGTKNRWSFRLQKLKLAFLMLLTGMCLQGCATYQLADELGPAAIPFGLVFDAATPIVVAKGMFDDGLDKFNHNEYNEYKGWKTEIVSLEIPARKDKAESLNECPEFEASINGTLFHVTIDDSYFLSQIENKHSTKTTNTLHAQIIYRTPLQEEPHAYIIKVLSSSILPKQEAWGISMEYIRKIIKSRYMDPKYYKNTPP